MADRIFTAGSVKVIGYSELEAVIYATLTDRSPLGLGGVGYNLPADERAQLQQAAWETVQDRRRLPAPAVAAWPLGA